MSNLIKKNFHTKKKLNFLEVLSYKDIIKY
jgi:hypothetical protein